MAAKSPAASTTAVPVTQGARARARAEITAEITAEARRHLATDGAAGLSLRAVARELGMVSSAVYRYVASRDDLLTILIIEGYDALGEVAERTAARTARQSPAMRWLAVCRAIRRWALAHPHEYALLYGSPVPGYQAPTDTIAPATRVTLALIGVVLDAHRAGALRAVDQPAVALTTRLAANLNRMQAELAPGLDVDAETVARVVTAWSQAFGLLSFELFGQTAGAITAHDDLYDASAMAMAHFIGLS
jgi:AcrR family transcriptional regulator